jgi:hypothetical protein
VANDAAGYSHELRWYGMDSVAHFHLMSVARDVARGNISKDDFVSKYELRIDENGIAFPFRNLEKDGIFVPNMIYVIGKKKRDSDVTLFKGDYRNRVYDPDWEDKDYALALIDRKWSFSDFENSDLVEQGIRFGKDMWNTCVEGFEKYNAGVYESIGHPATNLKVRDLGNKLIEYYSGIMEERK